MTIMAVTRRKAALQRKRDSICDRCKEILESCFLNREYAKIAKRVNRIMEWPRMKHLLCGWDEDMMTNIQMELGKALCDERQDELDAQNAGRHEVFTHSYIYQFSFSYTFSSFLSKTIRSSSPHPPPFPPRGCRIL